MEKYYCPISEEMDLKLATITAQKYLWLAAVEIVTVAGLVLLRTTQGTHGV